MIIITKTTQEDGLKSIRLPAQNVGGGRMWIIGRYMKIIRL